MAISRFTVLLVVIILLTAGCTGGGSGPTPVESPTPSSSATSTPSPTATNAASPTATETATNTATPTPRGPQHGTEWTVTITRVIDGDTVEARFPNGETDTLRLLGVDTPETTLSRVNPEEFEGIPDTTVGRDHLFNWGELAAEYANDQLEGETVRIEVDPEADRRGSFGRLLVYLYVDGENFNKLLLTKGYARVFESTFSKRTEFEDAEATARADNVGLWDFEEPETPTPSPSDAGTATRTATLQGGELVVSNIHADAEGNDHYNLNDEYIVFKNTGDAELVLSGWTVEDEVGHTYRFPSGFTLAPGATVTLYTGDGENTNSKLYWGSGRAIWNNDGDTIIVKDDDGEVIISREY